MTQSPEASPGGLRGLLHRAGLTGRALRHRNYRLYFVGQMISLIGTWMQAMAQAWLVYRLTGSSLDLGAVSFAAQVPVLILAPWAGVVIDRFDKRRIIVLTQAVATIQAVMLAVLTLTGTVAVWHVMSLAVVLGVTNAFDVPARQAFVVDMVGREDLSNAIALNSTLFNLGRMVGPAIGGVLVASLGEGWCFVLNALSYLAVIASLAAMRLAPFAARSKRVSAGRALIEGFAFARRTPPFAALFLNLTIISIFTMSYQTLMPIVAGEVLDGGPGAMGLLMSAAGLGALTAAIRLSMRETARGLELWPTRGAIALGLGLIVFSLSRNLYLSALCLLPVGFCLLSAVVATNTLLQAHVPDDLRGRIMSMHALCLVGMAPIGSLLSGAAAHHVGAPATIAIGGAILVLIALRVDRNRAISAYPAPETRPASP